MPTCKLRFQTKKPDSRPYPKILKSIGDHLKKHRLDKNLLQKQVASKLKVQIFTYRNWEQGHFDPEIKYLPRIIDWLGYVPFETQCKTLGDRILLKQKLLGLSQKQLADKLGLCPCTLRSWAQGKTKPTKDYLRILASFFVRGCLPEFALSIPKSKRPPVFVYPHKLNTIGDHIKKRRLEEGLTRRELAEKLDTTFYAVRGWELEQKTPKVQLMPDIITFLGYKPWDDLSESFEQKVKVYCQLNGLTKKELAKQLGVHSETVYKWLNGKKPGSRLLKKLKAFADKTELQRPSFPSSER